MPKNEVLILLTSPFSGAIPTLKSIDSPKGEKADQEETQETASAADEKLKDAARIGEEKLNLLMVDDHIPAGAKLY